MPSAAVPTTTRCAIMQREYCANTIGPTREREREKRKRNNHSNGALDDDGNIIKQRLCTPREQIIDHSSLMTAFFATVFEFPI